MKKAIEVVVSCLDESEAGKMLRYNHVQLLEEYRKYHG